MRLLQCSPCCNSQNHNHNHHQQESSQPHHLHSESSNSSSLSSQPSLPSVPSLTPQQSHNHHEPPQITAHHEFISAIKGHTSPIFSLALHGKLLFSGSSNSEIRTCRKDPVALQDPNNKNAVVAITNGAVKSMIVSNGKLFTAHQDHKIRVWRIEEEPSNNNNNNDKIQNQKQRNCQYKCIATLPTFHDRFTKLFSSKNYVEVRRHKKCTWVHHVDTVSALALSYDGALLYSVSWDRTFKIWRTSDLKCLESINAHEDAINALALSRDGIVYTGSADKKIKVWKKFQGEKKHRLLGTLEKHKSAVNALALSVDGSVLYSGACDRSILVWEKDEGEGNGVMVVVGALRGHTKSILCLVVVSDLVFIGSADNSVRIWKRSIRVVDERKRVYSCLAVLEGHRRPVKCLAVAVDTNGGNGGGGDGGDDDRSSSYVVYSGSLDCDIRVWKIRIPLFCSSEF